MDSPDDGITSGADITDLDELSDRQVEVLVYRVLAAVIAFLIAAAVAVLINSGDTGGEDQQVEGSAGPRSLVVVDLHRPS